MTPNYTRLHGDSRQHLALVLASEWCGCFHCLMVFRSGEVVEWWDEGQTAVCPHCGIDAVIASASAELTPELLQGMQQHWFG